MDYLIQHTKKGRSKIIHVDQIQLDSFDQDRLNLVKDNL